MTSTDRLSIATWMQRAYGRGSYTAHLMLPGRATACGVHLGYGHLTRADSPVTRHCRTCVNALTRELLALLAVDPSTALYRAEAELPHAAFIDFVAAAAVGK